MWVSVSSIDKVSCCRVRDLGFGLMVRATIIGRHRFKCYRNYHMLLNQQNNSEPTTSTAGSSNSGLLRAVWKAQVPPKVRLFILKACKNIIPTQTNLFNWGISNTYTCLWCSEEAETCDHVLWRCELVQRIWRECLVKFLAAFDVSMSFADFIYCCIRELQSPSLEIVFTIAWDL